MLLIAHNSEHRKSCSNYNLRHIPQTFGFAPAAAFPLMFRHCLLSFPTEATEVLLCISCHLPEATRGRAGVSGFWFGSSVCRTQVCAKSDTFTRSGTVSETGSGPDCRSPSCLMATSEKGDVAARSKNNRSSGRSPSPRAAAKTLKFKENRHDPISENAAPRSSPHSVSCPGMELLKSFAYQQVTEPQIGAPSSRGQSDLARPRSTPRYQA
jgi:hypothetical protein